jgi:hypothetical protein
MHLQVLVSQGFKMVAELATYRVHEDPASPAMAEGYVVAFLVFYGLELHNLTSLGILHITAFVTMRGLHGD